MVRPRPTRPRLAAIASLVVVCVALVVLMASGGDAEPGRTAPASAPSASEPARDTGWIRLDPDVPFLRTPAERAQPPVGGPIALASVATAKAASHHATPARKRARAGHRRTRTARTGTARTVALTQTGSPTGSRPRPTAPARPQAPARPAPARPTPAQPTPARTSAPSAGSPPKKPDRTEPRPGRTKPRPARTKPDRGRADRADSPGQARGKRDPR